MVDIHLGFGRRLVEHFPVCVLKPFGVALGLLGFLGGLSWVVSRGGGVSL